MFSLVAGRVKIKSNLSLNFINNIGDCIDCYYSFWSLPQLIFGRLAHTWSSRMWAKTPYVLVCHGAVMTGIETAMSTNYAYLFLGERTDIKI